MFLEENSSVGYDWIDTSHAPPAFVEYLDVVIRIVGLGGVADLNPIGLGRIIDWDDREQVHRYA